MKVTDAAAAMQEVVSAADELGDLLGLVGYEPASMNNETILSVLAVTAEALTAVLAARDKLYAMRNGLYYAARMRRDQIDIKELARASSVTPNSASVAINKITSQIEHPTRSSR